MANCGPRRKFVRMVKIPFPYWSDHWYGTRPRQIDIDLASLVQCQTRCINSVPKPTPRRIASAIAGPHLPISGALGGSRTPNLLIRRSK